MIAFGVGDVIGGLSMGLIIDKFGSKKTCFLNVFIISV